MVTSTGGSSIRRRISAITHPATNPMATPAPTPAAKRQPAFSLVNAGWRFAAGVGAGVAIGLVAGWVIAEIRRRIDDPPVEVTISLLSAYAAYIPAQRIG